MTHRPTIEQQILAARPHTTKADTQFADAVMQKIKTREIIANEQRRTNVKPKESFFMKLRSLNKPALVALALTLTFATAGTAYAIYRLWPKPSTSTSEMKPNETGRMQTSVTFENCGNIEQNQTKFEIKSGSKLTPEQVPQILQAYCEINAIQAWLNDQDPFKDRSFADRDWMFSYPDTYTVKSIDGDKITFDAQPQYMKEEKTYTLAPSVRVIANSTYVDKQTIKVGDVIAVITKDTSEPIDANNPDAGSMSKNELVYLIKMNLPLAAYDPLAQQSIAERTTCANNAPDICVSTGSVDLYTGKAKTPAGSGDGITRAIQGTIVSHDESSVVLKSTTGRVFTFIVPYDVIADYNKNRSQNYNNTIIGEGDIIYVMYLDRPGSTSLTADHNQIVTMQYLIELVSKQDPLKKY